MEKQKVIAIVGCGIIARNQHMKALSAMDNVRIKYACDILPGKAEKLKEDFPKIENAILDYKEALADSEVDAVFVFTPNFAHYTVTMDALRAGKHVFCEKPITVNYPLSCEMAEEANKRGLMLNIGVCNRYNKSVEMHLRFLPFFQKHSRSGWQFYHQGEVRRWRSDRLGRTFLRPGFVHSGRRKAPKCHL